jgi:hypothetical protein
MTNADLSLLKDLLSCHEATIARLRLSGGLCEWLHTVAATADALRSAIADIERLSTTKDGHRVTPGMKLYYVDPTGYVQGVDVRGNEMLTDNSVPSVVYESVSKMYADRKNAELAARDGQGG